jgi:hypothetical protein
MEHRTVDELVVVSSERTGSCAPERDVVGVEKSAGAASLYKWLVIGSYEDRSLSD